MVQLFQIAVQREAFHRQGEAYRHAILRAFDPNDASAGPEDEPLAINDIPEGDAKLNPGLFGRAMTAPNKESSA